MIASADFAWSGGTQILRACLLGPIELILFHDTSSEWLRRWTRNPLGSARKGSNPLGVVHSKLGKLADGNLSSDVRVDTKEREEPAFFFLAYFWDNGPAKEIAFAVLKHKTMVLV